MQNIKKIVPIQRHHMIVWQLLGPDISNNILELNLLQLSRFQIRCTPTPFPTHMKILIYRL